MATTAGLTINGSTNNTASINQATTTSTTTTAAQQQQQPATNGNRLLFNRLATERKTVHVMGSNLNKDLPKRDKVLASYNHTSLATATGGGGGMNPGATGTLSGTTGLQSHNAYYNNSSMGPSTLDYNMSTGRSHTNGASFLQKLSSKFTRR